MPEPGPRPLGRRRFLAALGTGVFGALIAAMLGVPIVGFFLSPLLRPPITRQRKNLGRLDGIPVGVPTKFEFAFQPENAPGGLSATYAVYAVRLPDGTLKTLSNICTHMQCPVRWEQARGQFLCPCHGGLYDLDGKNVGGPPPAPLPEWVHHVNPDGTVEVENRLSEDI